MQIYFARIGHFQKVHSRFSIVGRQTLVQADGCAFSKAHVLYMAILAAAVAAAEPTQRMDGCNTWLRSINIIRPKVRPIGADPRPCHGGGKWNTGRFRARRAMRAGAELVGR